MRVSLVHEFMSACVLGRLDFRALMIDLQNLTLKMMDLQTMEPHLSGSIF